LLNPDLVDTHESLGEALVEKGKLETGLRPLSRGVKSLELALKLSRE